MHTHRFGRKLKLPSTIAIKHEIRLEQWGVIILTLGSILAAMTKKASCRRERAG
jgi:hypothetical protein